MEQAQALIQDEGHYLLGYQLRWGGLPEPGLYQLQIPVAQFMPEELIDTAGGFIELIFFQGHIYLANNPI